MSDNALPRIRDDLQIIPVKKQGKQLIIIKDLVGILPEPIILGEKEVLTLSLLAQCKSYNDLQYMMTKYAGGVIVTSDEVRNLVESLDNMLLLDTEKYRQAYQMQIEKFAAMKIRPAVCAGRSYPRDKQKLQEFILSILDQESAVIGAGNITAIVAPHIDIQVGLRAYARSYSVLKDRDFERVIILGVGHSMREGIFSVTTKDFETPFGIVQTDRENVEKILKTGTSGLSANDFAHKDEHSIEFQLIFLQSVLKKKDFKIIPILMGSVFPYLQKLKRFREIDGVQAVLEILRKIISKGKGKTLLLAGVDLSHVGKKFGDRVGAKAITPESNLHDNQLLQALLNQNPEQFWSICKSVDDAYHVCGFSTLSCLLEILPESKGKLLHYETWQEDSTESAVSFASLMFHT